MYFSENDISEPVLYYFYLNKEVGSVLLRLFGFFIQVSVGYFYLSEVCVYFYLL